MSRLEKFEHHEERMAYNAENVLLLIQSGHAPDVSTAADMLGIRSSTLEHELESQSLTEFVHRLTKRRR